MHSLALYKSPKAVFVVYFCDSISEKTTCGGKDSFWFTVLETSAHGHLAPLLLGLGTGRLHNWTPCAELHSWMETAGSVGLDKAVKGMPPVTQLL